MSVFYCKSSFVLCLMSLVLAIKYEKEMKIHIYKTMINLCGLNIKMKFLESSCTVSLRIGIPRCLVKEDRSSIKPECLPI